MRILIAGGGGFLGSAICDRLIRDHYSLRIFERPRVEPYRAFPPRENVEWVTGDFSSRHDIGAALDGIDAVIHLVSTTLPKSSNDDIIYDAQTNLIATLQMLDEMVKRNITKIIFISSGGTVYGFPQHIPISENHSTYPICSYGVTKLAIEKYLHLYKFLHGITPVILRLANPYGPRQRTETAQGAIAVFLSRALSNQRVHIWGDGNVVRDYIYVGDVADAFASALKYEGDTTVFNIGSGTGLSLNELIEKINYRLDRKLEVEYSPARQFDVPVNILSIENAAKHLHWRPRIDIDTGLASTMQWIMDCYNNISS